MARRIVEEDVPSTTVVGSDGSWVGQTIVALVVIALLVVGAVYLFNNVGDGDGGSGGDTKKIDVDVNAPDPNNEPEPASS